MKPRRHFLEGDDVGILHRFDDALQIVGAVEPDTELDIVSDNLDGHLPYPDFNLALSAAMR